jgi:O-antigen/teichoic acid export membrane protein
VLSIAIVPFQGLITARENFKLRALVDIIKALLKLAFTILLILYLGNKLRAYALMMALALTLPSILLIIYARKRDSKIVAWKFNRKKSDYRDMFGFTGWITIGAVAYIGVRQGAALILNLFFGTIINAAFGIASQVNNYIMLIVKNLNQAAVPQIMKSYSGGNQERSLNLVYSISKYSFFIMLIPAVPIALSVDAILVLWLKEVPEYTKQFMLLMIINGLIGVTSSGFDAAIQATGKIKKVHIWYSLILISTLPIAYFFYKLKFPPYTNTILFIIVSIIYRFVQIQILKELTEFKAADYWKRTVLPTLLVSTVIIPQLFLRKIFGDDILGVLLFSVLSVCLILLSIYLVGLNKNEKIIIGNLINKLKSRS